MEENNYLNKSNIIILAFISGILIILLSAAVVFFRQEKCNDKKTNKGSVEDVIEEKIEDDVVEDEEEEAEQEEEIEESEPEPDPQPEQVSPPPAVKNWWDYPENIVEIPVGSVTHLTVVDKGNRLPSTYAPTDLVQLTNITGIRILGTQYVRNMLVEPLNQLGAAAAAEGIDLSIKSSYRSFQTQESTYQYWVSYNGGSVSAADQVSARPGHSEHQLGTVVDFSTSEISDGIGSQFNNTAASTWLLNNAGRFGFKLSYPAGQESVTGYSHEGWHWRYWGE